MTTTSSKNGHAAGSVVAARGDSPAPEPAPEPATATAATATAATDLAELEADLAAVRSVVSALSACEDRDAALLAALGGVRQAFGWEYGSYWSVDQHDGLLHFAVDSGQVNDEFQKVTAEATFAKGVGLAGRTWQSRDLVFVKDLAEVTDCVRAPVAARAGVKSGVCFPVVL
ncbi:MAG TPA: GAF domain-containing protein, partial [Acidimicrobiales bacterium]|nr:GAF domain-containing protein [Acidimicrobiales bacterium]